MTVSVTTVAARQLAAVRRTVSAGGVGAAWRPALDLVWAYLRANPGLREDGHNVFVYHHPAQHGDPLVADFGVEIVRAFAGNGEVQPAEAPAGEIAMLVSRGSYDNIPRAHAELDAWFATSGRERAGVSWEIYGDWSDNPAKLEVTICYLLR
ncbi:MAG TPA: GyrI-like domain-containing protein [Kofleriaceae bacterium]|jgi:effector-binding domain-containing protein